MTQRSTKGASKQRRDAINERVTQIRELLPVSEAARSRLSQLQVMALARSFIAKSNVFNQAVGTIDDRDTTWTDHFDFLQAVPGFLMIFGLDGRILYISDNVCDYLGNSAVDIITQTETLYELVDDRDHAVVRGAMNLDSATSSSSSSSSLHQSADVVSFVCRMNTTARSVRYAPTPIKTGYERSRTMQVRGRRLVTGDISPLVDGYSAAGMWRRSAGPTDCAFVAVCTPSLSVADVLSTSLLDGGAVAWDTTVFRTQHHVDMKFISVDANGEHVLGYERGAIYGKSWYEMIHPDDVAEASFKHVDLMQSMEMSAWRSLCVRVQSGRGDVIWLHVVMRVCDVTSDDVVTRCIVCINQVIDEDEARLIRDNAVHHDFITPLDMGLLGGPQSLLDGLLDDSRHPAGTKRRLTTADNWAAVCSPPKIARQTDRMFGDACLMSMPSPPLSEGAGEGLAMNCEWQTSAGGTLSVTSYSALSVDGFMDANSEPAYIPDSFLTPSGSPCSFTSSPTPVHQPVLLSDQADLNLELAVPHVEEVSFFDQVPRRGQTIKPSVLINKDTLPELDLPTVTSYLSCLEHNDPLPQTTPAGRQAPVRVGYSRAVPFTVEKDDSLLHDKTSTIDEDVLQTLFSTANSFLSSFTAVKPFDFCSSDLLFAQC